MSTNFITDSSGVLKYNNPADEEENGEDFQCTRCLTWEHKDFVVLIARKDKQLIQTVMCKDCWTSYGEFYECDFNVLYKGPGL